MKVNVNPVGLIVAAASAMFLAACGGNVTSAPADGDPAQTAKRACAGGATCITASAQYVVTASGTNLTIGSSNPAKVSPGGQASFTVTPNDGHIILNNSIGGSCAPGSWDGNTYTTGPVSANCTMVFNASSGTIRYSKAPGNGAQGHAGTLQDPYLTIWENIKAAQAGDVIYLLAGNYTAECPYMAKSGTAGNPIVLMGDGTAPAKGAATTGGATINCQTSAGSAKTGAVYMIPAYVTVQNLTIGPSPMSASGLFINSYGGTLCHDVVVDHVTIHDAAGAGYQSVLCGALTLTNSVFYNNGLTYAQACTSGVSLGGNIDDGTNKYNNVVNGNVAHHNGNPPNCNPPTTGFNSDGEGIIIDYGPGAPCTSYGAPPPGFHCATVSRTLIGNNILYANQSAGIEVYNGNNVDIVNNTLYQNQTIADHQKASMGEIMIGAVPGSNATSVNVVNNLIVPLGSNSAVSCNNFTNVAIENNLNGNAKAPFVITDNNCSTYAQSGNVTGNPALVNPAVPNFQLRATSAARRIGQIFPDPDWSTWLDIDYTGAARSTSVASDAGACKYSASPAGPCP